MNYYNEIEPYAADWLENLIDGGLIPAGHVDRRSIKDVKPDDLAGYTQCHFFCGIAGWPLALQIAGWAANREVWTGSPPCQDNSVAAAIHGKRTGLAGERSGLAHTWLDLIAACRPRTIFFENVPGIEPWIAEISSRLAGDGYRVSRQDGAAADLGAPHLRRRVWLSGDRDGEGLPLAWPERSPAIKCPAWLAAPRGIWREDYPGSRLLADGIPNRMAAIRAFGNAIVPQVAAEFIRAYMASTPTPNESE